MMMEIKGLLMFIPLFVLGSDNGKYYVCDPAELTSSDTCNFIIVDAEAPAGFAPLVPHTLDSSGAAYMRKVVTKTNTDLGVSPKPWTNGDKMVTSTEALSGPAWNYVMMFELMAPLRNALMYNQAALKTDEPEWLKLTKSLTDCKIKMVATEKDGKPVASTTTVYEKVKAPGGVDIHHDVLRYLEEGSIDLVCLTTSLEMSHCDEIRAAWGINRGTYCDCWIPAYTAMYGAPTYDSTFETCEYGSTPPEIEETTGTDGSSGNGPPDGGPDGGSSGTPPGSGNGAIANNGNAYLLASVLAFFGLLV